MVTSADLKVKLFADGADMTGIKQMAAQPWCKGFTTNPTLMRKAGITDYVAFAREVLAFEKLRPISFEVFADELPEMERQALEIASWGSNVYVKIPVMNTKRVFTGPIIKSLSAKGVQLNVTAVFTVPQVKAIAENLSPKIGSVVSVFAGRIADSGLDPVPVMQQSLEILKPNAKAELLWASPRELFNVVQADAIGCHIITATNDILGKLDSLGKDNEEFSLETVQMFYRDATAAGYKLST